MKKNILVLLVISLVLAGSLATVPWSTVSAQNNNPILQENQKKGTQSWKSVSLQNKVKNSSPNTEIEGAEIAPKEFAPQLKAAAVSFTQTVINGYAGKTSINKGESLTLHVSSGKAKFNIEFYRLGYYSGDGARLVKTVNNVTGVRRTTPAPATGTGLIEAKWPVSYTLQTDSSWVSGVYLAKLVVANADPGYITFVVRDDGSTSPILYQIPVTTYQAYNNWGGKSLYDFNSQNGRSLKVSFDRPYSGYDGAGGVFDGDYNMIRFLESRVYSVTYATNLDLHQNSNLLQNRKVFLSNWHDEYYSKAMKDNLTNARDRGVNLAFFAANNIYWQVRFENGANGAANRVMTCYKDANLDPLAATQPQLATVTFRNAAVNDPENGLLGIMYESDWTWGESVPWIVKNANNWIYEGTGVSEGTAIAGLVGYEYDKTWNNGKTPSGLTALSFSPTVDGAGLNSFQEGSIYQANSGAWVFAAGTIYWPWKLDDNDYHTHGADIRVQKMTTNILDRMIGGTVTPTPTPTTTPTIVPTVMPTVAPTPSPTIIPTPSPTAIPTVAPSTTPSPTPGTIASYIYNDSLTSGWSNWSWSSSVAFNDTSAIFAGTKNLKWTANSAWAGLYLHKNSAMSTNGLNALSFALRRSNTTQTYSILLYNGTNGTIGNPKLLSTFASLPAANTYQVYNIPLSQLGGVNALISGVQLQDESGKGGGVTYIDELGFK